MISAGIAVGRGQEARIISRYPNVARIARAWNALIPATQAYNEAATKVNYSFHNSPPGHVLDDKERVERVGNEKIMLESLLKEVDSVKELLDEEDDDR